MPEGDKQTRLRNGVNTGTQNYRSGPENENYRDFIMRRDDNVQVERGLHESFDYYDDCYSRERNRGKVLRERERERERKKSNIEVCRVWRKRERGRERERDVLFNQDSCVHLA